MSARVRRQAGRVLEAGDSALLLRVGGPGVDADVNARAIAIAAAVRSRALRGVRDVVPTFSSVAVFFDALTTNVAAVAASLHDAEQQATPAARDTRAIDVPVVYGGEFGPDVGAVAEFARCSPEAVIDRHASRTYRVFMLGFLPGFPYMASVDDTIAAPRRATPRVRVPAGSVGIAGRQTGIYPRESPGGWQIIGRTPLQLFDPDRTPPALFAPGDVVRFVPVAPGDVSGFSRTRTDNVASDPTRTVGDLRHVTVLRPGLLTTIQDSGRWGYQDQGVPVAGPMDRVAHRLANALVGNFRDAATLETTLVGPELRLERDTVIAITGADLGATLDGLDLALYTPVAARAGSILWFGARRTGARAYVAFDGGIAVTPVLGSRATHLRSGLGGLNGGALAAGDRLPLGTPAGPARPLRVDGDLHRGHYRPWPAAPLRAGARLRVLPGPQAECFPADAFALLQRTRFTISTQSDRMGFRLSGGTIPCAIAGEMISDAAFIGGLQVPPSGEPILLMADRQTTGGYPQIGIVITADLPVAAQLAPGDWVEFEPCTRAEAIAALVAQEGRLLAAG